MGSKNVINGITVTGINFGVRREVLAKVAEPEELEHFIKTKNALYAHRAKRNNWWYGDGKTNTLNHDFRSLQKKISKYEDDLKGYRKAWRCIWTDSMKEGLYTVNRRLSPWALKSAVGKYGFGYSRIEIKPGDIFLFIGRDKKGDVEFLHQASNKIIKLPRGSGISDSFCEWEENTNENI